MATEHATNELRKMPSADLEREVQIRKIALAKHALGVHMGSEKNTSQLKRERRGIARMLTIRNEQRKREVLKEKPKTSTVSAPRVSKKKISSPAS